MVHAQLPDPGALVLIVDDDEVLRQGLIDVCATVGIRALGAASADEALQLHAIHHPAVVVCDFRLPDGTGIDLAGELKIRDPEVPVLLLTGYASLDSAIAAVGQLDAYLIKPVPPHSFIQSVRHALARRALVNENRDLVERLERLNTYQALYDPLTGLPNRALLDDRLSQAIAGARRTGSILAVLFVDLDGFKVVNDLFGHHVGDELLCQMADRLANARRQSDTVARFGGDEFVVVCPDIKTSAAACRIADHLLDELAVPAEISGVEHRLTASVGIAVTSPGSAHETPRCSCATPTPPCTGPRRRAGPGGSCSTTPCATGCSSASRSTGVAGRHGVGRPDGGVSALIDLGTGEVVGAEALLRWYRDGYGTILPSSFLAVAEESGLIVPMGRWALDQALTDLAAWRAEGRRPERFRLWVNLSPHQSPTRISPTSCARRSTATASPPPWWASRWWRTPCGTWGRPSRCSTPCASRGCPSTSTTSGLGTPTCRGSKTCPSPGSRSTGASWPPSTSWATVAAPPSCGD